MFDNPKKELQELEGQLLAAENAEENQDNFEEIYNGILEEYGPRENPGSASVSTDDPPIRNFANGYGRAVQNQPLGTDGDEILDDAAPAPAQKGVRGLVVLACLECLGIAAIAVYWVMNFL